MIRTIARRLLLIIALSASILAFGAFSRVSAYELYELNNLAPNGNMDECNGSMATRWTHYLASSTSCGNSVCKANATNGATVLQFYNSNSPGYIAVTGGHIYYLKMVADYNKPAIWKIKLDFYASGQWSSIYNSSVDISGEYSTYHTAAFSGAVRLYIQLAQSGTGTLTTGNYISVDSIILIDLTAQFGAGNEPSITDFELLYLPDMDYFDDYGSFIEDSYTDFSSSDYTQLGDDLTGINYSRSIIDTYGANIDIDIYAYFFDTPIIDGDTNAQYYVTLNNPVIKWGTKTETLSWTLSTYSDRVILLDMDDEQEELAKRALFDRNIGGTINGDNDAGDNGYMSFVLEPTAVDYVKFYIVFSSVFDLRVDLSAVMLSYEMDNGSNEFGIAQECYFKFEDKYNNIIAPSLRGNLSDYGTYVINDFGSQYTDVSAFNVEFEFTTPEPAEDDITFYLYELGAFSSNDVVFGFIAPELPLPFEPGACDWYEFGCQAKNGANEFVAWFYEKLDIAEIVGYFETIIDGGSTVISLMPDSVVAAFTVIGAGIILAISLVILDKVKGNGG